MSTRMTTVEWEMELGQQLRDIRLRQNINQHQLAERADVALNVVKRLESGKGVTTTSLIKVLQTLGREDWIGALAPRVSVSPLQLLKTRKPIRQRASPSKRGVARV